MRRAVTILLAVIFLAFTAALSQDAAPAPAPTAEGAAPAPSPASTAAPDAAAVPAPAAATSAPTPAPTVAPVVKPLSVADIITLSQAGLSEEVIVAKVKKNGQAFDLSPDELLQLKTAKVSDKVIQYMLDPAKPDPVPVAAVAGPAVDPNLPDESGVYWRKQGEKTWNELLPEVVNWKTGGVLKGIATYGIVKKDLNGHLEGKTSKTTATTATEFLIVVPDGISIAEYQLLRLRQNSDNREFRSSTGGVFHQSGGATRDLTEFQNTKIAPHRFLVTVSQLKKGEYGFLPPGAVASQNAAGSTGKIYTFSMLE